ncbi:Signal transduction histidine kinase [Modicisalibacter muralis]|uniref:histidine kinase n=1 Tax=Modicisalibacter muralis TaxID=119000 RepID=A0A1G9PTZ2_9GAMM|nr:HAMP domain-containing sensor histidine kinase [Halomonas muralis]SDM02224.1 Signal transduction histidine kinase [Halomonas muralis]
MNRLGRLIHSLYARIALVYLTSLLLLSVATAWIAISQFNQLGREFQQRMEIDLAANLARVMQEPLRQGANSPAARQAARHITSINSSLSLYLLDENGRVVADYAQPSCGTADAVDVRTLETLLGDSPMLPVMTISPCSHQAGVFSVARIHYGPTGEPGYLYADLNNAAQTSTFAMLRTSSITRTLVFSGLIALLVSGAIGLIWFGLLTRRFSALIATVRRFSKGDYSQRAAPLRDDEIGHLARAFNDMAGTIDAQIQAMRETDRQRRELIANLSHDFRTPLTSLRGYAERLLDSEPISSRERSRSIQAIMDNADRLTRLSQQLSTLSRLDAYDQPLQLAPFSLAELAHDIVGKFQHQAREAGVTLSIDCEPSLAWVSADLGLIDRVLSNLIDNALHATDSGGSVRLTARAEARGVKVTISDDGAGIAAEEVPLITQRFYRTASSRAQCEGSGLGLSIVREICERHDAPLQIRSQPGKGTEVSVVLAYA